MNGVTGWVIVVAGLIVGLAIYYLAELRHWLQDRRVAARIREASRNTSAEPLTDSAEAAAFLLSLREGSDR